MKKEKILLFILGGLGVLLMAGNLHAGSIDRAEIWLTRYQDEALNTYYGFYADIWGTVEEFQSIVLTSPLNDTYPLAPAPGGDHWSYYEEGDGADITSEFVNGPYSFAVTYTDTTGGAADVFVGSDFPAFPESLALTGNTVSWESWPISGRSSMRSGAW